VSDTLRRVRDLVARKQVLVSAHGYDELAADDISAGDAIAGPTLRQCSLRIIRLHRRDLPSWCFRRTATTVPFMSYGVFRPGRKARPFW